MTPRTTSATPLTNQVFTVGQTKYHQEGASWWVEDERLPAWTGVADTQAECEALRREAMAIAPVQAALDAERASHAATAARVAELRAVLDEGVNGGGIYRDDPNWWSRANAALSGGAA